LQALPKIESNWREVGAEESVISLGATWSIIPGVRNKLMIGCDWPNVHSESTPGAVRTNDAPLN